ncbi:L-dopachrome tautomerase-related protein [Pseudomonas sp. QD4]|uniref:L-dopachrome tautomerase-related protein n=1 Tax=Pseudomonas sp. QD4 TaxID=3368618 RepID=UPI003B9DE704
MRIKNLPAVLAIVSAAVFAVPMTHAITAVGLAEDAPADKAFGKLEQVHAFYDAMPTGVTVSETGRIFVNFPRWGDTVPFTVGEIRDGKVVAYPNAQINQENPRDPGDGLISVQSVVADGQGRVWLLDTAAPGFSDPKPRGAKLVAVDLASNRIVKRLVFPDNVMLPSTYVNDMRFDFRTGTQGTVYITDSSLRGPGAIIVMDIASGRAIRRLSGGPATSVAPGFVPVVEGLPVMVDGPNGERKPLAVASDGIALSADGNTLYFTPLSSRHLFAVSTALLRDANVSEQQLAAAVQDLGEKGASDGLEADADGAIYAGDYEHNAIRKRLPDGRWQTLVHDPRLLWPDTLAIGPDGYLYFTANQLHRQAVFRSGQDQREKPYSLMRLKIDAAPAPTR